MIDVGVCVTNLEKGKETNSEYVRRSQVVIEP